MSGQNVFGPVWTLGAIKRPLITHLRLWLPDYLREVERAEGMRPDGRGGWVEHEAGTVDLPKSWRRTNGDVRKWPEDQLPAVLIGLPGLTADGVRIDGRHHVHETHVLALSAMVGGRDYEATEWLSGVYVAALELLMIQQPNVAGLPIERLTYADKAHDVLPDSERSRTLVAGTATFTFELRDVADASAGPIEPSEDPVPDPGAFPEVEDTEIEIERSAI